MNWFIVLNSAPHYLKCCTQRTFDGGKVCRTVQVKAIGKEKFGTVSAYAKYIFSVSVNNGKENFGE